MYDQLKQKLFVEYLISSPDLYALCIAIIEPDYFDTPNLQNSIIFIKEYYEKYHALPSPEIIEAEIGEVFELRTISRDKIEYCSTEIEKFCQSSSVKKAMLKSIKLYEKNDLDGIRELMKETVSVSLTKTLGIDFFEDPENKLKLLLQSEMVNPTGWTEFDRVLDGGISRKQMLLFSAVSGGGKSIVMANLGLNFVQQGKKVLYISFELPEEMIYMRYVSMTSGYGSVEWRDKIPDCAHRILTMKDSGGKLLIKRMPQGSNANKVRAYLKEYEMRYGAPDMIIFDYLDLMSSNQKISSENLFIKDKFASEEIREIGEDYNAFIVTASQLNRSAVKADIYNHSHIAGGISKINTTDVYASILFNDVRRAQGAIGFRFEKTRTSGGVGTTIELSYNKKSLRITNQNDLTFKKNTRREEEKEEETLFSGRSLLDMMDL